MGGNRLLIRLAPGLFGVLLLTFLLRRAGPATLAQSIANLGWRLSLVIALGGFTHLAKTWAWRLTLVDDKHRVPFRRALGLRLGSEAIGHIGIVGQVFGEAFRVSHLSSTIPLASGIVSVTLDRALFIICGALISALGLTAVLVVLPLPHVLSVYGKSLAVVLVGVILLSALAVRRRWRLFSRPAHLLSTLPVFKNWIDRKLPWIHSVESRLLDYYHATPGAFWGSFTLNLACHAVAVMEVYLILHLMGLKLGLFAALAIEALTKLVNSVGAFNPGNVGTYEGGNMLIAGMFGLSAAAGLTLAVARRIRAIFWASLGCVCLVAMSKPGKLEVEPVIVPRIA
jgi:hypothetical protein